MNNFVEIQSNPQTEISSLIHCQCLAIDFRGHGDTKTDDDEDLSAGTMATDIGNVIQKLYEDAPSPPYILLMGKMRILHFSFTCLHIFLHCQVIQWVELLQFTWGT